MGFQSFTSYQSLSPNLFCLLPSTTSAQAHQAASSAISVIISKFLLNPIFSLRAFIAPLPLHGSTLLFLLLQKYLCCHFSHRPHASNNLQETCTWSHARKFLSPPIHAASHPSTSSSCHERNIINTLRTCHPPFLQVPWRHPAFERCNIQLPGVATSHQHTQPKTHMHPSFFSFSCG